MQDEQANQLAVNNDGVQREDVSAKQRTEIVAKKNMLAALQVRQQVEAQVAAEKARMDRFARWQPVAFWLAVGAGGFGLLRFLLNRS